jgi:hypothetical protein
MSYHQIRFIDSQISTNRRRWDRMVTELNLGSPAAMPKDADPRTFCEIYYLDITNKELPIEKIVTTPFLYHKTWKDLAMAKDEYPERHSWWLNELESLGINTSEVSIIKDPKITSELTMDIKQIFYEEYKKHLARASV